MSPLSITNHDVVFSLSAVVSINPSPARARGLRRQVPPRHPAGASLNDIFRNEGSPLPYRLATATKSSALTHLKCSTSPVPDLVRTSSIDSASTASSSEHDAHLHSVLPPFHRQLANKPSPSSRAGVYEGPFSVPELVERGLVHKLSAASLNAGVARPDSPTPGYCH